MLRVYIFTVEGLYFQNSGVLAHPHGVLPLKKGPAGLVRGDLHEVTERVD